MADTTNHINKPTVFIELDYLVKQINEHPELKNIVDEVDGVKWLAMTNAINGHVEVSESMMDLLVRLSSLLDGEFITSEGQHSNLFYAAKNYGYGMRTGESDSFGPLSSVMKPPNTDWQVCYG